MLLSDVERIEALLRIRLPAEYRDFVTHYPPELHSRFAAHEILDRADFVINNSEELNEACRPPRYLIIGDSGCGDYYCLDLSEIPERVMCLDHELGRFTEVAWSFAAWVRKLTREAEGA